LLVSEPTGGTGGVSNLGMPSIVLAVCALFGVGLTHARSRRDQSRDVSSVCGGEVGVFSEDTL